MYTIIQILLTLIGIFIGVPGVYYLYLWRMASKPWNLKIDKTYTPSITIIIPTHNEERTIGFKLRNLSKVLYPREKMQIILVDDASTDGTLQEVFKFVNDHPELNFEIVKEKARKGKSSALNTALKHVKNDIIVVTDADTFWDPNILRKSLPFLSDPSVGAISGKQNLLNVQRSLLSGTEKFYLDLTYQIIKLGESKIHSTILFHGLFSAYKRRYLDHFNLETDDSGTALDIVQKGVRTIYVPDAMCYEIPFVTWRGKLNTKLRRASQLVSIYLKCLKLLLKKRLLLPMRIAIPEIFIYVVNPLIFLLLIIILLIFSYYYFYYFLSFAIVFLLLMIIPRLRFLFVEAVLDNIILLCALLKYISGRKFTAWETLKETRITLNERLLENLV